MPNAGHKKHLKPKRNRVVDVVDFARGFIASCGGKDTAITKSKSLESAALKANPPDTKTANFYANLAGHIGKLLAVLMFLSGCTEPQQVPVQTGNRKCSRGEAFNAEGSSITVFRCEMDNNEICYISVGPYKGGVSCFEKRN